MRKMDWLQRILYLIMAVLGSYILAKGSRLLLERPAVQNRIDDGSVQKPIEDAAMRTLLPGYTSVVEGKTDYNWVAEWMKPVIPVYSYLAESEKNEEQEQTDERNTESAAVQKSQTEFDTEAQETVSYLVSPVLRQQLSDFNYLLANYYTVDHGTSADESLFHAEKLLSIDLRLKQNPEIPQILIYHTHSQEAFADSREGKTEDTIVGMGEVLAEHLREYGYQVIHDTASYDLMNGVLDRSAAYDYAREAVEQTLEEYPTIEVIVDLHRDGVDGTKFVTEIGGKPTAKIMFFNGISRDSQNQELSWLPNEYLTENLAFSLQMQLLAEELYPDFTRNIYLKAERFNLHLRPRSLLVEAGTQLNTVEEEKNAMGVLAELLHNVLEGNILQM